MRHNFALIGAAGYVAPRHLKAIHDTGNTLVAAVDPHDAVGILDRYSFEVKFFPEIERFDRFLDKLRRGPKENRVQYVSICSPNFLHDAHIRLALRNEANVICEKPLVINPWNLDALERIEEETGRKVSTVLQLRIHPSLMAMKQKFDAAGFPGRHQVVLTYITGRGAWYHVSWKGSEERSGGLVTNIGIHLFDLLLWLFGDVKNSEVHLREPKRVAGCLELARADVRWFLSLDTNDLPFPAQPGVKSTYRSITADGEELEFTEGFSDLHTRVYEKVLAGESFGIKDARPSIELVHRIRTSKPADSESANRHPFLIRNR
jgi:UDP-N-acetyl-2-amino-2-deoxyglucuronate dehydrogenase